MRTLLTLITLLVAANAGAQAVLPRLIAVLNDESAILAAGENSFLTKFIEVDREVPGTEHILTAGIMDEASSRYVIVTPTTVHMVERAGDTATYSKTTWGSDVLTRSNSRFNTLSLNVQGEGTYLTPPEPVVRPRSRPSYSYSPPRSGSYSAPRSSSYSSTVNTTTCTSTTDTYSSSVTCRTNGRIVSTTTCRMNPRTYEVTCSSRDYY